MKPTQKGREFINRLMLQEGTYKGDYSIYSLDSLEQWVAEFKGLYIVPAVDQTTPNKGNIYATSLDALRASRSTGVTAWRATLR